MKKNQGKRRATVPAFPLVLFRQELLTGRALELEDGELIERPESKYHFAPHQLHRNDTELTAVSTLRTIVPEQEEVVRLDDRHLAGSIRK